MAHISPATQRANFAKAMTEFTMTSALANLVRPSLRDRLETEHRYFVKVEPYRRGVSYGGDAWAGRARRMRPAMQRIWDRHTTMRPTHYAVSVRVRLEGAREAFYETVLLVTIPEEWHHREAAKAARRAVAERLDVELNRHGVQAIRTYSTTRGSIIVDLTREAADDLVELLAAQREGRPARTVIHN